MPYYGGIWLPPNDEGPFEVILNYNNRPVPIGRFVSAMTGYAEAERTAFTLDEQTGNYEEGDYGVWLYPSDRPQSHHGGEQNSHMSSHQGSQRASQLLLESRRHDNGSASGHSTRMTGSRAPPYELSASARHSSLPPSSSHGASRRGSLAPPSANGTASRHLGGHSPSQGHRSNMSGTSSSRARGMQMVPYRQPGASRHTYVPSSLGNGHRSGC